MLDEHLGKVKDLLGSVWVNLDIGSDASSILRDMEDLIPLVDSCLEELKENDPKYTCLMRFETIFDDVERGQLDLVEDCDDIKVMVDEILDVLNS